MQQSAVSESGGIVHTILAAIIHGLSAIANWIGRKMDRVLGGKTEAEQYERFYESTDRALVVCKWVIIACVARSEERRVGKECRSRWSPYH